MVLSIILNSSHVSNIDNSEFSYPFKKGGLVLGKGAKICVSQVVFPYAFFNVNKGLYNNASFSYKFPNSLGVMQSYTVLLTDGFYQVADIYNVLMMTMISNNQYLVDTTTGDYYFFINL